MITPFRFCAASILNIQHSVPFCFVFVYLSMCEYLLVLHAAMYFTTYKKQTILYLYWKAPTTTGYLSQEGLLESRIGIDKFLKRFLKNWIDCPTTWPG